MGVALLKYDVAPDEPLDIRWQGEHASDRHLTREVFAPSWVDIKRAIRRLDGRRHTSVTLWPSAEREEHDPTGKLAYFSVTGGSGLYVARATAGGYPARCLFFPEWPWRDVIVLPDPRGYLDGVWAESAPRVCRDVGVVLQAARYFAERGGLDPSLTWEPERPSPALHLTGGA